LDFNKRIENLLERMDEKDFDGMIVTEFNNIKYLSNYYPNSLAICILKEDPIILTSAMDKEAADETSSMEVKVFKSLSEVKELIKKEKLSKIAIEANLPISSYKKFQGNKDNNENWDLKIANFLEKERMVKDMNEIAMMRKATDIAHKSFKELNIREKQENGVKDWEVAYELGYLMRSNGAFEESFETIVATDSNSSLPHARVENKTLGNLVLMDWGSKYKGYCSDTSRTIIDENNKKQQEIFDIVLEAHNLALKSVKSGIKACEVDKVARSVIEEYGWGDNFIHSTGHSLGLDIHESPNISKKDETILEENMVITIEPGVYLEGEFGVRIEDMVIVGKRGSKIIGNLPYKL